MKTSAQELFLQANQCYTKKEYQKAAELYEKIPKKSAVIWYNFGNAAYKNGKDLHALLYWQRAKKLGNEQIRNDSAYNIGVVSKKLNLHEPASLMNHVPIFAMQILFFCAFSVFLVINRKLWHAKRFALLLLVTLFVIGSGALTCAAYRLQATDYALTMHEASSMYAGPDCQYHEIAQIPQASQVAIRDKKNGWSKISWSGHIGWIENKNIEVI